MARSEDAQAFLDAVYDAIQEVPRGRVTSYAHIAKLVGKPRCPRQVGVALKHLPSRSSNLEYHEGNVPWQRVINSKGAISPRGPGSAERHAAVLRQENVEVTQSALREYLVDFSVYGWFPEVLPSEEGLDSSDEDTDG